MKNVQVSCHVTWLFYILEYESVVALHLFFATKVASLLLLLPAFLETLVDHSMHGFGHHTRPPFWCLEKLLSKIWMVFKPIIVSIFQSFLNYNNKRLPGPKKNPQGSNSPLPLARRPPTITKATITMVIWGKFI
jgi:hypothetical protein